MNNMKKILVYLVMAFITFVYFNGANADSITDYKVPVRVPLNENLTIYGVYSAANTLCAFYVFDLNNNDSTGAVTRLPDLYSFSDGSFYQETKITEPLYRRGMDYNVVTKCGTTQTGQIFQVSQKEEIALGIMPASIGQDLAFFLDTQNTFSTIILFFAFLFLASIIGILVLKIRG